MCCFMFPWISFKKSSFSLIFQNKNKMRLMNLLIFSVFCVLIISYHFFIRLGCLGILFLILYLFCVLFSVSFLPCYAYSKVLVLRAWAFCSFSTSFLLFISSSSIGQFFFLFSFCFETDSHCVGLAGLEFIW